jgi:hypothetical protein
MPSKVIRVKPSLAVNFSTAEVNEGTLVTVEITGLSHDQRLRKIKGSATDKLPEAAICAAFGNAYEGIETEAIDSNKKILAEPRNINELVRCLALAHGVPLGGTLIVIPF